MKNVTAALWFGLTVALIPAAALADDDSILNSSAGARSGAERLGGINMTAPAHAWTGTGQSPQALSTDDTRKEQPRNPAVVGPPVPRQPQSQTQSQSQPEPQSSPPTTTDQ